LVGWCFCCGLYVPSTFSLQRRETTLHIICRKLQRLYDHTVMSTRSHGQLVTRSTRHAVDSSQKGGQLVTSKSKQTSKPYCRSSNYTVSLKVPPTNRPTGLTTKTNSAFAIVLTVIFNKTYIVQKVTFENSTRIIIKSCDSADKLFTQKILIKTVS